MLNSKCMVFPLLGHLQHQVRHPLCRDTSCLRRICSTPACCSLHSLDDHCTWHRSTGRRREQGDFPACKIKIPNKPVSRRECNHYNPNKEQQMGPLGTEKHTTHMTDSLGKCLRCLINPTVMHQGKKSQTGKPITPRRDSTCIPHVPM